LRGARIRINESPTSERVIRALGARPTSAIRSGPPVIAALQSGALDAVEADMEASTTKGYIRVAPYVLASAPLFAKTTTLVAATARLRRLDPRARLWLASAAADAVAAATAAEGGDRSAWSAACGQGLRPLEVAPAALMLLRLTERGVAGRLARDPATALALDRIGLLATAEPRRDPWSTCQGEASQLSPTAAIDGTYTLGGSAIRIRRGRYAILRPVIHPVEVGSVTVSSGLATLIPDDAAEGGEGSSAYRYRRTGRELRWVFVSGRRWPAWLTRGAWLRAG
jgi:hypothetical protein